MPNFDPKTGQNTADDMAVAVMNAAFKAKIRSKYGKRYGTGAILNAIFQAKIKAKYGK